MKKIDKYSDKEWEELASLLSDETGEQSDLLEEFMAEDDQNTGKKWKELKDMGDEKGIDVDKAWNNLSRRMNETEVQSPVRVIFSRYAFMKIAAVALVILGLGTMTLYLSNTDVFSKKTTVATDSNRKNLQVLLPDGSKIFLNRNTELSYRANFGKKERKVSLKGEAFFEISPDKSKPFVIDADKANVKVVGTSFNVITKNSESAVEVFVKTGKVMLSNKTGSESLALDPGYIGIMDTKVSEKTLNSNPNYLSWNTGLLVYNGQKLDVVFSDLKRVYNMDIVADDKTILDNPWTLPIDNQPQETIIKLICASYNLSYTRDGNVYHLTRK